MRGPLNVYGTLRTDPGLLVVNRDTASILDNLVIFFTKKGGHFEFVTSNSKSDVRFEFLE